MKQLLLEEIKSNEELISQFRKEIEMLQTGTSIGAMVPRSQRSGTIESLQRSIKDRQEANRRLHRELEELSE